MRAITWVYAHVPELPEVQSQGESLQGARWCAMRSLLVSTNAERAVRRSRQGLNQRRFGLRHSRDARVQVDDIPEFSELEVTTDAAQLCAELAIHRPRVPHRWQFELRDIRVSRERRQRGPADARRLSERPRRYHGARR
jgi:hypothetical protein